MVGIIPNVDIEFFNTAQRAVQYEALCFYATGGILEISQVIVTHPCVYDERLEQLEQVYTLLNRLNSSDLVLEVSKELDKSVPDMMESVCALIGTLREYRAVSAAHI